MENEKMIKNKFAIIGLDCRFPGATCADEFWDNICNGIESVGSLPRERASKMKEQMKALGVKEEMEFKVQGYLNDINSFDHDFFGIINREAVAMSPAQRLFMEVAYHALEDAGYGGTALYGSDTGVFVGYIADLESQNYLKLIEISKDKGTPTGALSSNLCGRFSYYMNFSGPSMLIDTACSSSLTALNVACNSIINGECQQALVGGVQIDLAPYNNVRIGIESASGHVKPFDQEADGTCSGEGVAAILIKKMENAIADKDNIYAVIDAVGVNQDGRSIGLSAPNPSAQKKLISDTFMMAGKTTADISYLEAHGTGTGLGDPIEMNVLASIFRDGNKNREKNKCAVGSVKANIGHLYAASGLAGIIKCCYMLKCQLIPMTINFKKINEKIKWENTGLYINTKLINWDTEGKKRCCGISNFGFSGTNCHVILEEYEDSRQSEIRENQYYPFVISEDSFSKLNSMIKKFLYFVQKKKKTRYIDVCYTAAIGRKNGKVRLAINANSVSMLMEKLELYKEATDSKNDIYMGNVRVLDRTEATELIEAAKSCCVHNNNGDAKQKINSRHLCELYVAGITPEWEELYKDTDARKISLPLCEYDKNEFSLVFE